MADDAAYTFSGNVTRVGSEAKNCNAIYMDGLIGTALTYNLHNGGSYTLNDNVQTNTSNSHIYTVAITGNGSGDNVFNLNNEL